MNEPTLTVHREPTQVTIRVERKPEPGYFRSVRRFKREARSRSLPARVLRRLLWAVAAILALFIALGVLGSVAGNPDAAPPRIIKSQIVKSHG